MDTDKNRASAEKNAFFKKVLHLLKEGATFVCDVYSAIKENKEQQRRIELELTTFEKTLEEEKEGGSSGFSNKKNELTDSSQKPIAEQHLFLKNRDLFPVGFIGFLQYLRYTFKNIFQNTPLNTHKPKKIADAPVWHIFGHSIYLDYRAYFDLPSYFNANKKGFMLLPVLSLSLGMAFYFLLSFEPDLITCGILLTGAFCLLCLAFKKRHWLSFMLFLNLFVLLFGFNYSAWHTHLIQTKYINPPQERAFISGTIETLQEDIKGYLMRIRVEEISDLSQENMPQKARLYASKYALIEHNIHQKPDCTNQPMFQDMTQIQTPFQHTNRINHDTCVYPRPKPQIPQIGDKISGKVFLLHAPEPQSFYDSYNQQRTFWFDNIGAVGTYYRAKITPQPINYADIIEKTRTDIARFLDNNISGENNGIMKALILGETRYIKEPLRNLYRALGLSHLLAVSGFHIGFIALLVYFFIMLLFPCRTRAIAEKVALLSALCVAGIYTLIAGAHPPAIRAFLTTAFIILWKMSTRQGVILYFFGMSACIMLLYKPSLVLSAGFQLSFIAVLALISFAGKIKHAFLERYAKHPLCASFLSFVLLSIIVTLSTMPIVMYHFHQFPIYGVIGNIVLSCAYSLIVMPLLLLASLSSLFFDNTFLFDKVNDALTFIHFIGEKILSAHNTILYTPTFAGWGLVAFIIGFVWICLFKKNIRLFGYIFILLAPLSVLDTPQPDMIIGAQGRVIGIRKEDNSWWFSESHYHNLLTRSWLLSNGENPYAYFAPRPFPKHSLSIKGAKIALSDKACHNADLTLPVKKKTNYAHCQNLLTKAKLQTSTPLLVFIDKGKITLKSMRSLDENRLWGLKVAQSTTPQKKYSKKSVKQPYQKKKYGTYKSYTNKRPSKNKKKSKSYKKHKNTFPS